MKKIVTTIAFLFFCTLTSLAQNTSEDISNWYNSLKSAAKAADKAIYADKMLGLKTEGVQPQMRYLIDASLQIVAATFAEEANFPKAMNYAAKINDEGLKIGTDNAIAEELIAKGQLAEAHKMLDTKIGSIAKDEKGNRKPENNQMQTTFIYGTLLMAEKKYQEAANFYYPALEMPKYGEKYQENYIIALSKAKSETLNEELIKTVYFVNGKRSQDFKTEVQNWYNKTNGNDKEFQELEKLKQEKEAAHLEEMLAKMKVDFDAPDMKVLDMNGKEVALSSLRGKTVILDFWATWCQPCVASFPGMQKAVNYFKNEPSVVFMFIHTQEKKGANVKQQVQDLLDAKGYKLDVYLDLKDPATGKSPGAAAFKVGGIPAKFIINKQGRVKFSNSGYVSEDEAIDEIKRMIELANQ